MLADDIEAATVAFEVGLRKRESIQSRVQPLVLSTPFPSNTGVYLRQALRDSNWPPRPKDVS